MNEEKLGLNWSAVEKALAEGTFSGYKIGILETEKLFNDLLKNKQIPGNSTDRKIKYVKEFMSQADKLNYSRHIYERIVNEPHFEISREETKHVIAGYWQAMIDIEEAVQSLSRWEKIVLRLKFISTIAFKNVRALGLGFLILLAAIWFLAETGAGQTVTHWIIIANHFIIFKILFWLAIILLGIAVIGGILYIVLKRKREF